MSERTDEKTAGVERGGTWSSKLGPFKSRARVTLRKTEGFGMCAAGIWNLQTISFGKYKGRYGL